MIRLWLTFIVFAGLIHLGVTAWRDMTGKERWSLTKTAIYSIIISLLALIAMTTIVIVF